MITKNSFIDGELMEPYARYLRFERIKHFFPKNKKITLADYGCGFRNWFYLYALEKGIKFKKYVGIDPLFDKNILIKYKNSKDVLLIRKQIDKRNKLKDNSFDFVTELAVLEHVDNPGSVLKESLRVLKKKGKLILTTPTPLAKPILEFLSFKLHIISPRSIAEHKTYSNKESLLKLIKEIGYEKKVKISHKYFEFGLNNLVVITKL